MQMVSVPDDEFIALWRTNQTLNAVVDHISEQAGVVPRCAVLARAVSLRAAGVALPAFPDEAPPRRVPEELTRARDTATRLMAEHGLRDWVFGFNKNVRRAGVCKFPTATRPGRIELSGHFVLRNPWAEVLDTILHELAHALVGPKHGHDAVWRAKCVELGARPERCFGGEVEMPTGRWRAACPRCAKTFDRHRRPKRLTGWFCKGCGPEAGKLTWQLA
jgi:predicted SprT family Zn-dependent metalloprotease